MLLSNGGGGYSSIGDNLLNQILPFVDYGIQSGVEGCLAHKVHKNDFAKPSYDMFICL